ncbi:hypothetical protein ABBQ38_013349 [Trebouxia sp. C0009 RCD-2024]
MKLPTWMRRNGGGKRQRRKKARAAEQASVAADGTSAPAPHELRSTPSLQKPGTEEIYYDAEETLSDYGDTDDSNTMFPLPSLLRRLSSAHRAPSKNRHLDLPTTMDSHGNRMIQVEPGVTAPEDAVMMPLEHAMSGPGCLSLFNSAGATAGKRFVRTARPAAGSSLNRQMSGADTEVGGTSGAWSEPDATSFMVRGSDYMKTRRKVNSDKAIYRLVNVDVYSFDFKLDHIAKHLQLPAAPRLGPAAMELPPEERLPPVLVVNLQLPTYPASLFGGQDGQGLSLVYYFTLPEGWEPNDVGNTAALQLLQRFIHDGREQDNSRTRDRLKLIPRVSNLDEWAKEGGLSGAEQRLLHKYNDKPLLTKPQHRFYSGPNYFEMDLDVHAYAYLARKAFSGYLPRLGSVVFENALVIQGNRPEELPEVVLGAARIYRTDFMEPRPFPASLMPTSPDVHMPDTPTLAA